MSSVDEDEVIRLQVAEEAVKIVRQFNNVKGKEERQKKIIDLCTDIAGILDAKRRLENLVEKQKTEIEELRKQANSAQTSSTSGRGSISPEESRESNSQVLYTPSSGRGTEVPCTPSSGRGTAVCDRGTSPVYGWPEKTSTCTRSTSPILVSSLSSMYSLDGSRENLTNQEDETNREAVDVGEGRTDNGDVRSQADDGKKGADEEREQEKENDGVDNSRDVQPSESDEDSDKLQNKTKEDNSRNPESSSKSSPQSTKRSGRVEASPKKQEKKKGPARDPSPRKSAAEKQQYKPKERTYKTLWKTNQLNLFDDNKSSAKQRKNNTRNRTKEQSSPRKPKNIRGIGLTKNTANQHQSESSSSSCDSDEDEEMTRESRPELTTEYWDIHKLIRFLKIGNPTATVISLCALRDLNLELEPCQLAILELGGINVLLNLLKTGNWRCVIGSLKILRLITNSKRINMEIYRLGGVQQLIECLHHDFKEVQSLAAETLSHVVTFRLAYSAARRCGGIKQLVNLLRPQNKKHRKVPAKDEDDVQLTRNACMALWSCSRSPKNIQAIRAAGAVPLLASLLLSGNGDVILPAMGIVQECAAQSEFREDVRREGMVEGIVKHLRNGDIALKTVCANALFKCAEDDSTRELISRHGGLELLVQIIASRASQSKELLAAAIGALWKCALNKSNVRRLEHFDAVKTLILLLKNTDQSYEVLANALGAMHEFAYNKRTLLTLKDERVIPVVVRLLTITEGSVLVNATRLLTVCGREASCRGVILHTDGLRLLWSLLKSPDLKVVASSADAISECVVETEESADIVRSFVGGLELITSLLRSDDKQVLVCASRAIINIGRDRENLSIMTDYEVVPLLISLSYTEDEELKRWVAEAIATCSGLDKNVKSFSSAVVPLADSLKRSSDVAVRRAIACALERLSRDPYNCYLIHQHEVLKTLLTLTGSPDERVQEAAAGCIKNMRINTMNVLAR